MAFGDRIKRAWNAFRNINLVEDTTINFAGAGSGYYGLPPQRTKLMVYNERSIISAVYTRIAIDVAGALYKHVKLDDQDRYKDDIDSPLNMCLNYEPNLDQGPRAFRQDIAMTLFDQGVACLVPVETSENPKTADSFDIYSLRVGWVVTWYPQHVKVSVYNEISGKREEITLPKRVVAIIENPLYAVMNEPNSTLQRLLRKLALLDTVDEQTSSGKLDIIIQLPYTIKSDARREQAERRREDIEFQLSGSKYGIAYIDGTEKVTQLNRPAENNLLTQVEYLTKELYAQLGLTDDVMNGTADEGAMRNYFTRTIEPILDAIIESMQRAFLGPRATANGERVLYFKDPFKLVPLADLAELGDKFTRNEILTANEMRQAIGIRPSKDPQADELRNSNMPEPEPQVAESPNQPVAVEA